MTSNLISNMFEHVWTFSDWIGFTRSCKCAWGILADPAGARHNERLIAALNAEREDPQYRSRAGRLDKWRELYASAQKELQLPDAPPDRLTYLNYPQLSSCLKDAGIKHIYDYLCIFMIIYVYLCYFMFVDVVERCWMMMTDHYKMVCPSWTLQNGFCISNSFKIPSYPFSILNILSKLWKP